MPHINKKLSPEQKNELFEKEAEAFIERVKAFSDDTPETGVRVLGVVNALGENREMDICDLGYGNPQFEVNLLVGGLLNNVNTMLIMVLKPADVLPAKKLAALKGIRSAVSSIGVDFMGRALKRVDAASKSLGGQDNDY